MEKAIREALEDSLETCIGCQNQIPLTEMNPANELEWLCRGCYYKLLEGLAW